MLERCHVGLAHSNGGTEDAGLFSFTILFCTSFEVLWCQMGPKHPVCLQMGGCIRVRIEPNFMCFAEFVTLCEVGSATRPPALTWLPMHWLSELRHWACGPWKCLLCNLDHSVLCSVVMQLEYSQTKN